MLHKNKLAQIPLILNALTTSITLAVYAYLGLFARFMGDDYCHHALVKNKPFFAAVQHHYTTFSNRYMILTVPYLTEKFGTRGQSFLPITMILLWLIALYWLLKELHLTLALQENKLVIYLLTSLLTFFTILQAPARYQSIYWEASSINRLVSLVLTLFLFASLLTLLRKSKTFLPPEGGARWGIFLWSLLYFIITFLIGGFDEMNDTFIFAISFLFFAGAFFWMKKGAKRTASLWLTSSIFLSSLASMLLMVIAPHNSARITHPPTFFVFVGRILTYPKYFYTDATLTPFPLPTFLSVLVSFLVFSLFYTRKEKTIKKHKKLLWILFFLAPLLLYTLLIVNFAPSAYAQSYPAARALLGARFFMTLLLFVEGALLSFLLRPIKSEYFRGFLLLILGIFSLYPLRAAWQTFNTIDFYRQRATAWDLRDDKIRSAIASGEMDIHIQEFDSIHIIKELDSDSNHWINRCAARYYGVDSISADANYDE